MEKLLWAIAITNLLTAIVGLIDKVLTVKDKKPRAGRRKASTKKKRK